MLVSALLPLNPFAVPASSQTSPWLAFVLPVWNDLQHALQGPVLLTGLYSGLGGGQFQGHLGSTSPGSAVVGECLFSQEPHDI